MSFLGALGKIGKIGLNFIPGGGVISSALDMAGDVGSVMDAQRAGKNDALAAQANLNTQRDRNAIDLFQAQQNAQLAAGNQDLQRKQFESQNRSTSAKQALIGALLGGGLQPTVISGGKATGGLTASLNANPEALAAMKMLASQGAGAQSSPLAFEGGKLLTAPTLSAMPKIDTGGGFLGTLSKIGELAGAASPYLKGGGGHSAAVVPALPEATAGLDPRLLQQGIIPFNPGGRG